MSDATDQMALAALYQLNNSVLGRTKTVNDTENRMILVLLQINQNLIEIKKILEGPKGDGLIVRTQQSHA